MATRVYLPPRQNPATALASLEWNDFGVVSIIRKGDLCDTFQARALKSAVVLVQNNDNSSTGTASTSSRTKAATRRQKRGREVDHNTYALKCLKKRSSQKEAEQDAKAFALEVLVLTELMHHPNVIRIKGASRGFQVASSPRIFCVLEVVEETLQDRLGAWRSKRDSGVIEQSVATCLESRIQLIAMKIANAMDYVHAKGISMGNLSPTTVGFDRFGNVKLMDFSEARLELVSGSRQRLSSRQARQAQQQQQKQEDAPKTTTATRGSNDLRYKSPESFRSTGDNKNEDAYGRQPGDVYSFAILLWEIITLEVPYDDILASQVKKSNPMVRSLRTMKTRVSKRAARPKLSLVGPPASSASRKKTSSSATSSNMANKMNKKFKATRNLLRDSWDHNPFARPSFIRIWLTLDELWGKRHAEWDLGAKVAPIFSEFIGRKKVQEEQKVTPDRKRRDRYDESSSETDPMDSSEPMEDRYYAPQ